MSKTREKGFHLIVIFDNYEETISKLAKKDKCINKDSISGSSHCITVERPVM